MRTIEEIASEIGDSSLPFTRRRVPDSSRVPMKLFGKSLGYLINFHVPLLKQGLKRIANNYQIS